MKRSVWGKFLSVVLSMAMLLMWLPVAAMAVEVSGDYEYTVSDGSATITRYNGSGGAVVIPAVLGGYSVTSIGDEAFYNRFLVTSVVIPEGVTSIGDSAFYSCSGMTSVVISEGVTSIGDYAFRSCWRLTNAILPESVKTIGEEAFRGCESLTNLNIPEGVTSIGNQAFISCTSLTSINIPEGVTGISYNTFLYCTSLSNIEVSLNNQHYSSEGGVLFNKDKSVLLVFPAGKTGNYNVPSSVTSIADYAFYFSGKLTSVAIPKGVTSIGDGAFALCTNLTNVTIPEGVSNIGDSAFRGCSKLTSVIIPEGVTSIGDYAFYDCANMTSVIIPDSVTSIGNSAFNGCQWLTSVTIPEGVTNIGDDVFYGCYTLSNIDVNMNNQHYSSEGGVLFNKDKSTLMVFPAGISGHYTIPSNVTSINDRAFAGCLILASVTIPESVKNIGDYAFALCLRLTDIIIPSGVTSIGNYTFYYCFDLMNVDIPNSVTSIGNYAFANSYRLENISIPENVTEIGDFAFRDCIGLKGIVIPRSVTSIGANAFYSSGTPSGHLNHTIYGYIGSYAESYANANSIAFVALDEEGGITDAEAVAADKAALTWESIRGENIEQNEVMFNLATLPTSGVNDTTITWASSDPATVSAAGEVTHPDSIDNKLVTLTATITKGDESDTVVFALTVIGDGEVIVNSFTITATAGNGGTATGGGIYDEGETVTLTATPNSNYSFNGWYEGGALVSGATATYTFAATADRTLEARFISSSGEPITSIKIDSPAMTSIPRNSTATFSVTLNPGASDEGLVWKVSDPSYATVDAHGTVTTHNKAGLVILMVEDPASGISQLLVLRIS
jgi:hypothetical protein